MHGAEARQIEALERMKERLYASRDERARQQAYKYSKRQTIRDELEKRTKEAAEES
jgi:hypothetical protein